MTQQTFTGPHEASRIISKLFNVDETEAQKHVELFSNINPHIKSCLTRLAKMDSEDNRINAAFSLQYILTYKESAFD